MWSITVIYYWKIWFLKWAGRHKTIIYSCKTELELALYTCSSSEKTLEECAPVICLLLLSVSFLFKQLSSIWTKQNDHSAFNNNKNTIKKYWILFFSFYLTLFLFFANWMRLRRRLLPTVISFYTMGGCLFIFLNIDRNATGNFFKMKFNNFY